MAPATQSMISAPVTGPQLQGIAFDRALAVFVNSPNAFGNQELDANRLCRILTRIPADPLKGLVHGGPSETP